MTDDGRLTKCLFRRGAASKDWSVCPSDRYIFCSMIAPRSTCSLTQKKSFSKLVADVNVSATSLVLFINQEKLKDL